MRLGEIKPGSKLLLYTAVNRLKPVYGKTILQGTIIKRTSDCTIIAEMTNNVQVLMECICEVVNDDDNHTYRYNCVCSRTEEGLIISSHVDCDWHNVRQETRYNIKIPCYISVRNEYIKATTNDISWHGISVTIDKKIRISIGDICHIKIPYGRASGISTIEVKYVTSLENKTRVGGLVIENANPMNILIDDYINSRAKFVR